MKKVEIFVCVCIVLSQVAAILGAAGLTGYVAVVCPIWLFIALPAGIMVTIGANMAVNWVAEEVNKRIWTS